jgi:hypothetical protein
MSTRKRHSEEEVMEGHEMEAHHEEAHHHHAHEGETEAEPVPEKLEDAPELAEASNNEMVGKIAMIAVVGVGAAIISAELIPGMLLGLAAAFLPGIGPKLRPLMKSTIRAGYAAVKKTKEMVAEASEQMQDVVAEARSEHAAQEQEKPAQTAASAS